METCVNCENPYYDIDNVQRCRRSALETELIVKADNHAEKPCKYFVPSDPESIVPMIFRVRWEEEVKLNRLTGWRSIAEWAMILALQAESARQCSPLAGVMNAKAKDARRRMIALQPERDECNGYA